MKKRSLKLLVSLILAMTLVMGMSMSVFAATYGSGSTVDFADLQVGDVLQNGVTLNNNGGLYHVRCLTCKIFTITTTSSSDALSIWDAWEAGDHAGHNIGAGAYPSYLITAIANNGDFKYADNDGNVPTPSSSSHSHSYSWHTVTPATANSDGVEVLSCSCGDVKETQYISAAEYIYSVNSQVIDLAKPGAPVVVDIGRMNVLPKWFMQKLLERDDLNITLKLRYDNQNYSLVVPKTAKFVDEGIDFYGPLKLMSMFPQK